MIVRADLDRPVAGIGDVEGYGRLAGVELDVAVLGDDFAGDHVVSPQAAVGRRNPLRRGARAPWKRDISRASPPAGPDGAPVRRRSSDRCRRTPPPRSPRRRCTRRCRSSRPGRPAAGRGRSIRSSGGAPAWRLSRAEGEHQAGRRRDPAEDARQDTGRRPADADARAEEQPDTDAGGMEKRCGDGEADAEGQRGRGAELAAMGIAMEQGEDADERRAERRRQPAPRRRSAGRAPPPRPRITGSTKGRRDAGRAPGGVAKRHGADEGAGHDPQRRPPTRRRPQADRDHHHDVVRGRTAGGRSPTGTSRGRSGRGGRRPARWRR